MPHKYSDALWKRFVGACDKFFEAKKKANSEAHGEEKANMEQKQGIISALKELAAKEGEDIMQQVKELQQKWNEIGHVPFREKDRLYKEYREVCDKIYGAFSATQRQRRMNNFRTNLAQKIEKGASTIDTERQRMMRAYERMQEELKTYENNLCFLTSNSKKGNSLVDLAKKKADKLREELSLLAQKIKAVDEQIPSVGVCTYSHALLFSPSIVPCPSRRPDRAKKRSKDTWQSNTGYLPVYPWIHCQVSKDTFWGQFSRPEALHRLCSSMISLGTTSFHKLNQLTVL